MIKMFSNFLENSFNAFEERRTQFSKYAYPFSAAFGSDLSVLSSVQQIFGSDSIT